MDFRGFDCGDYQLWKLLEMKYKNATYMMLESVAAPGLFFHIVEKENIVVVIMKCLKLTDYSIAALPEV